MLNLKYKERKSNWPIAQRQSRRLTPVTLTPPFQYARTSTQGLGLFPLGCAVRMALLIHLQFLGMINKYARFWPPNTRMQLGRVRWASRRGKGEPNPPRETKNSDANGGRNGRTDVYVRKTIRRKKHLLEKRGGEGKRDGAQPGDKRTTTVTELAEGNSSSLPITCGRCLWMESTAWEERRRSSTYTTKWAATSSVCRKHGVAASLLLFKLDMVFTREEGPRLSWTGCSQEYLPCRITIAGVHQRHATEGDARNVRSSLSCDVCCWVCTDRHSICWGKARLSGQSWKGS